MKGDTNRINPLEPKDFNMDMLTFSVPKKESKTSTSPFFNAFPKFVINRVTDDAIFRTNWIQNAQFGGISKI